MYTAEDIELLHQQILAESQFMDKINESASKVIVGQTHMLNRLMIGLLTNGHVLLEGLPGLAKTLAIRTLAKLVDASFQRVQFTPDLLPADIVGTMIFNPGKHEFVVQKGPIFANFILADEINRAPAKVQSALLEAMQERQVTIAKESYNLQEPFLVLATQNPIEQEGTYPLPEAQVDRFMLKVKVNYPTREEERIIMRRNLEGLPINNLTAVVSKDQIIKARSLVKRIYMDEKIEQYILDIVFATRDPKAHQVEDLAPYIQHGASPRASINLALAAKAHAFLSRRAYVIPEDVRLIAMDVMRHRIGLSYEAEAENIDHDDVITNLLNQIEVP